MKIRVDVEQVYTPKPGIYKPKSEKLKRAIRAAFLAGFEYAESLGVGDKK